jgi:predicted CxxxxCH...CXXCH cytochrome family protein
MLQIILKAGVFLSSAMVILSLGCSDAHTPKSLINPDTGKHDAGWESPDAHGAVAKAAAGSTSGFAVCQECHADKFNGGISNISCLNTAGCHGAAVSSPHSPKPWRGGTRTHTNTDQSNAPVCALCHTNGANSSVQPSPFDSGAAPGCFNNTLCHSTVGHQAGWELPSAHGTSAKSAPTSTSGFSYCQICHGNDFTGGDALQTCLNTDGCHGVGVNAPHAASWMPGGTYTHTTTDQGNAPVCAFCHLNDRTPPSYATVPAGTTPDCFNNTLCHGVEGHAAGWSSPDIHGASAKDAPGTSSGFAYCETCHGTDFAGGGVNQSCFTCHGVSAPHSPKPWRDGTRTHTTTNPNNASVCALCHTNGANSTVQPSPYDPIATPGCFNNTLCHAALHAVPFTDPALHGPVAKADLTYCQSCHSDQPTGGAGSNPRFNVAKGSLATGCESASCHASYMAHPTPWRGLIANDTGHMNAGNMSNACALCHGVNLAGGVGPACTTCHTAGSPLTLPNCTSCHGKPPTGSAVPNRAGAHAKHNNLANVTNVCNTCHSGAGTGTANHFNSVADVALLLTYQAESGGTATFNAVANTCSNVSCHGGQTTPSWLTGTITVNTQCTSCHALGSAQFNSYNSGQHSFHLGTTINAICTDCHDTAKLANVHFNDLNTDIMSSAYQTIVNELNYTGTATGLGYCGNFTCHSEDHTPPRQW